MPAKYPACGLQRTGVMRHKVTRMQPRTRGSKFAQQQHTRRQIAPWHWGACRILAARWSERETAEGVHGTHRPGRAARHRRLERLESLAHARGSADGGGSGGSSTGISSARRTGLTAAGVAAGGLSGSRGGCPSGMFLQLRHRQRSPHFTPSAKHSQYFFWHDDFLQWQPL